MTEPKKRNSTSLMLLLLYALLIASLLVLTLAGARLYSDTMDARDAHAKQRSAPDHTALSGRVAFDCCTVLSDNSGSASCATSLLRVCSNQAASSYTIFSTMSIGFLYFACILEYKKSRSISASADTISPDSPHGA